MEQSSHPFGLRLSEGLGLNAQDVERKELTAALDNSGSVVLIDDKGDIVFYAADGKMQVQRLGRECDACIAANLALAEAVAGAWNTSAETERLRAALAAAVPAMRKYARKNHKHHFSLNGAEQDPNGVHAWLAEFGA